MTAGEGVHLRQRRVGVLSNGSRGPGVEAVQWALSRAGVSTVVDGVFGDRTERSVRSFQSVERLTVDGLVGRRTWERLGLLADDARPPDTATPATTGDAASGRTASDPRHGAIAASVAAHRAGFRGPDLATIVMIAGRESRWQSDRINPHTSDRGMWQINWNNLQRAGYDDLRAALGIERDADLLDLETNAAVAFRMYQDSVAFGEPWFPWRGSDTGRDGTRPGWDPKGSHTWHTEEFAAESEAAAAVVLEGRATTSTPVAAGSTAPPSPPTIDSTPSTTLDGSPGTFTITTDDSDGFIAVVGRCLGLTDAAWALRRSAAEAVAAYNGVTLDEVWHPGDMVRFPPAIEGVRSYTVEQGDGLIAIATSLGLGRSPEAQHRITVINAWQGTTPHPGDIWYGGPA